MSAQDRTLDQYHELMQINAVSHIIRAAREVGILDRLSLGQHTAEQLCEALSLHHEPTALLIDSLLSTGVIERYGDDLALSQAARLLCQYDRDLGDAHWRSLAEELRSGVSRETASLEKYRHSVAATQWVHTPAAMQAAEILDVANLEGDSFRLLDLGGGSGVWSCAMAYAQPAMHLVFVGDAPSVQAATSTATSIELGTRSTMLEGDPLSLDLGDQSPFDFVLVAQYLHALPRETGDALLKRAAAYLAPGGKLVVIDLFRGPAKPTLSESVEALKLQVQTPAGQMYSLEDSKQRFHQAGLENIQFSFIASSRINLGLLVGQSPR